VNKIDLAPYVGANLDQMRADVAEVRGERPWLFTNLRSPGGARPVLEHLQHTVLFQSLA
jgi:urease accessory protein